MHAKQVPFHFGVKWWREAYVSVLGVTTLQGSITNVYILNTHADPSSGLLETLLYAWEVRIRSWVIYQNNVRAIRVALVNYYTTMIYNYRHA